MSIDHIYSEGEQLRPFYDPLMNGPTAPGGSSYPAPSDWAVGQMMSVRHVPASECEDATPCQLCGGPVSPAEGVHDDRWRAHTACHPLTAQRAVLGVLAARGDRKERKLEITLEDAELLLTGGYLRGMSFATVEGHPRPPTYREKETPTRPWSWVSREQLDRLRKGIAALPSLRAKAGLTEHPCSHGPCAWCGRRLSKGWHSRGHRWRDGSEAPICGECVVIFDKYRSDLWSSDWDSQRGAISEALSGIPRYVGERVPESLRAFAEVTQDRVGGQPWGHLNGETVQAFVWDRRGMYPRDCPEHLRAEAKARWEAKTSRGARMSQLREARAAQEREARALYRF